MSTASGTPAGAPKPARKLPFKRTVKRKSVDVAEPSPAPKKDDDDVLSLFKRSGGFFEEQRRLSAAKSDKKRKPSPPDGEDEAAYSTQAEAQLVLESSQSRPRSSSEKQHSQAEPHEAKRVCVDLSDDDDDDENNRTKGSPAARRDSSALKYPSTRSRRSPAKIRTSPRTPPAGQKASPEAISLEDSDDMAAAFSSPRRASQSGKGLLRADSDSELEEAAQPWSNDDELDDMTRRFVLEARERMEKEKAARLAREANAGAPAAEAEATATIMIESHVQNTRDLTTKVKLSQQMKLVKSSWILYNIQKKSPWSPEALEATFFTWKGRKIYPHTTLASLGIKPDVRGNFYSKLVPNKSGFVGWDKVHFEAWTQDLFEEAEREKERERMRQLGELDDASDLEPSSPLEEAETAQPETKIRLICKSRNHGTQNMTVPLHVTMSAVATAFRRMKQIPEAKRIEFHFDGETLELSSTLEEAGVEDEDCVEVHIT